MGFNNGTETAFLSKIPTIDTKMVQEHLQSLSQEQLIAMIMGNPALSKQIEVSLREKAIRNGDLEGMSLKDLTKMLQETNELSDGQKEILKMGEITKEKAIEIFRLVEKRNNLINQMPDLTANEIAFFKRMSLDHAINELKAYKETKEILLKLGNNNKIEKEYKEIIHKNRSEFGPEYQNILLELKALLKIESLLKQTKRNANSLRESRYVFGGPISTNHYQKILGKLIKWMEIEIKVKADDYTNMTKASFEGEPLSKHDIKYLYKTSPKEGLAYLPQILIRAELIKKLQEKDNIKLSSKQIEYLKNPAYDVIRELRRYISTGDKSENYFIKDLYSIK